MTFEQKYQGILFNIHNEIIIIVISKIILLLQQFVNLYVKSLIIRKITLFLFV